MPLALGPCRENVMTFANEGRVDRVLRLAVGVAALYMSWVRWPDPLAIGLLAVGLIATITGLVGWCPLYSVIGCSTSRGKRS
jgi:hypothetical protein